MGTTGLSPEQKKVIEEILNTAEYRQRGFDLSYSDDNNPAATIVLSSRPEYRFSILVAGDGSFATSERPGVGSDEAGTFNRADFSSCIRAFKEWTLRIVDREAGDWILDEFGGVADRNPWL